MKKHLIAAAVAGALAVPAMAQVTVSGALEAGYASTKLNGDSNNTVSGNVFQTPFLKFSGSEDLGGGMTAFFTLTNEFNTATGAESGTGATDVFEETSVGLSGGFGSVKLGRFNHTARDNAGVYRFAGEFARVSGAFRGLGSQPANSIEYTTPSISGFSAAVGYSNAGDKDAAADSANQTSFSAGYKAGPINVRYSLITSDTNAARKNKEQFIGATYDLGMAKVGLLYATEEATVAANDAEVTVLNAAVPLGSGMNVQLSYHMYENDNAGAQNADLYGVALTKDLSKRTMAYIGYINSKSEGTAYSSSFVTGTANRTNSGTAIGIRHTF